MDFLAFAGDVTQAGAMMGAAGLQAQARKEAADRAAESQERINQWMIDWAKEQQGEGGAPVFMPRYARELEQQMFGEAEDIYGSTFRPVQDQRESYERIKQKYQPMFGDMISDIESGRYGEGRLKDFSPVAEARSSAARTTADSFQQALQTRLGQIQAQQRQAGFGGTGAPTQNLMLGQQFAAQQSGAAAIANANIQNALQEQAIRDANAQLQMGTALQAPQLSLQAAQFENLVPTAMANEYMARMGVFSPYRVQRSPYSPALRAPNYAPDPSMGAAILGGLGGAAGAWGDQYANLQLAKQMQYPSQSAVMGGQPMTMGSYEKGGGTSGWDPFTAYEDNYGMGYEEPRLTP